MLRDNYEIVRSDNPKCKELENAGYNLIATSWGAHLDIESNFDIENLKRRIENCKSNGYRLEITRALFKPNSWTFGAFKNDKLIGVCATSKRSDMTEIDFGSVTPSTAGLESGLGLLRMLSYL